MFDECKSWSAVHLYGYSSNDLMYLDVEHASAPNALSSTGLSLPHVQYEGFEPSPYPEDDIVTGGAGVQVRNALLIYASFNSRRSRM